MPAAVQLWALVLLSVELLLLVVHSSGHLWTLVLLSVGPLVLVAAVCRRSVLAVVLAEGHVLVVAAVSELRVELEVMQPTWEWLPAIVVVPFVCT